MKLKRTRGSRLLYLNTSPRSRKSEAVCDDIVTPSKIPRLFHKLLPHLLYEGSLAFISLCVRLIASFGTMWLEYTLSGRELAKAHGEPPPIFNHARPSIVLQGAKRPVYRRRLPQLHGGGLHAHGMPARI